MSAAMQIYLFSSLKYDVATQNLRNMLQLYYLQENVSHTSVVMT